MAKDQGKKPTRMGRPKKPDPWNQRIFVRINGAMKDALAKYRDRHSHADESEAVRDIFRKAFEREGLL
jgi:hypothetical protein